MNCWLDKGQDPSSERRHRSARFVAVDAWQPKSNFRLRPVVITAPTCSLHGRSN